MIGVLEDDLEGRQPAMRSALTPLGLNAVFHDNAPDMIRWLGEAFDSVTLLCLDHDLGPTRAREGGRFDPGTGRDVVEFLASQIPSFPVIVHSSNPVDGPGMVTRLEGLKWDVCRIVPWGEEWIPTVWIERVRAKLAPARPAAPPLLPRSAQRTLMFEGGPALGVSTRWEGGQYCAILTRAGLVGCGIYDLRVAGEFGMAMAIARGTPARPLIEPEDLLEARILEVSPKARERGIEPGMTGREAVEKLLAYGSAT